MPEETPQLVRYEPSPGILGSSVGLTQVRDISRIDTELKEAVKSPPNKDQHPQFFQGLLRQ